MALIHQREAFSRESILANAKKFGFVNPLTVELFLWDLELAAQLQTFDSNIIMKGGAATQLLIPLDKQRGSVDVDLITGLDSKALDNVIKTTESRMGQVKLELYTPRNPKPGLDVRTYYALTKSVTQQEQLRVKLDFMLNDLGLPHREVVGVQTFAVKASRLRCFTPEVLVGDKILTLAKGSIGLKDLADYPKQIYDLSMLLDTQEFHNFEDVKTAIERITPVEAKIADYRTNPTTALDDVIRFIDAEVVPVDTTKANQEMKSKIEGFEQFFVPTGQRANLQGWSTRALRIRFVANLAQLQLNDTLKPQECEKLLSDAKQFETKLDNVTSLDMANLRNNLLLLQKTRLAYFGELRGKPLKRVFWQVVSPDNIEEIAGLV
jgi:predicted nucleotidyltransferase component of viral defense system